MSLVDVGPSAEELLPGPPARRRRGGPWAWAAIACILLGASGAVRAMQDRRHKVEREHVEVCPIELASIPKTLGVWHLVDGGDRRLDDLTLRITGSSQHIVRTYVDDLTGVTITALVLYGPAEPVLPHSPDVCYPASGFARAGGPSDAEVKYELGRDENGRRVDGRATFRSSVFQKSEGRLVHREAVYHSFRLDGQWSSAIGDGRKFPRRNPGIFKVQVQRQVAEGESLGQGDPMEQFLSALLTEIEKEIRQASGQKLAAK
jgi:hypothetical protein